MRTLGLVLSSCLFVACAAQTDGGDDAQQGEEQDLTATNVIFSPAPKDNNHLTRIAAEIDKAKTSIDIAIYSYSDAKIGEALARAVTRGVKVRFVYNDGGDHQRAADRQATPSGKLEKAGVNVRYINKIMHHKFMIVDGPRDDAGKAKTAMLVTGSANWTAGAATLYDENTIFMKDAELATRYQREFETMWAHSKDFEGQNLAYELGTADLSSVPDVTGSNAIFTSANFSTKPNTPQTFSVDDTKNELADAIVSQINAATKSIHVASCHFRSRPVAEALIAKKRANPDMDIRVYVDGQEYLAKGTHDAQVQDVNTCIAAAGANEAKKRDCTENDFLFSYQIQSSGIPLKYKYYAYRWQAQYAPQMHEKLFIFDGKTVMTGSYNLSNNAEHETFENFVILDGTKNASAAKAYEKNFESIWVTGEAEGKLAAFQHTIEAGGEFPIVFEPMALDWQQVTDLKNKIRDACPSVDSLGYRTQPLAHQKCTR